MEFLTWGRVLVLAIMVSSSRQSRLDANNGIMIPDTKTQVVQAGATITVTCMFIHYVNISWKLPDYLSQYGELSNFKERVTFTASNNDTHVTSTMSIQAARARDTGQYECYLPLFGELQVHQYIYVYSKREPLIFDDIRGERLVLEHNAIGVVPCKPTHPNITLSLHRTVQFSIDDFTKEERARDLLAIPNPNWVLNPRQGLTIKSVSLDDYGGYSCKPNIKNSTYSKTFRVIVSGIDLIRDRNSIKDPTEGDSVNLTCRAYLADSTPQWFYFDKTLAQMTPIDPTSPPDSMELLTETIIAQGENLPVYKSRLTLFNITLDLATTFQCKSLFGERERFSNELTLRIIDEEIPVIINSSVNTQVIISGQSRNLSCVGYGSPTPEVHWLKNGELYTENIYEKYNTSRLVLEGTRDDEGFYSCVMNNSQGFTYRNFTVRYEGSKVFDTSIIIAVGVTVAVLFVAVIGLGIKFYLVKKRPLVPGAIELLKGNPEKFNKNLNIDEQIELLPYDKRWEFPRNRLKLGIQLGAGCFGRVVKGEAIGIKGATKTVKTVAVKMVRTQTNVAALEALVSELKIMIHLGSHLNVVNLLGACTKNISKGDILVIVEYCPYGNLQTYLINHRSSFINQVDEFGNLRESCDGEGFSASAGFNAINDGYIQCREKTPETKCLTEDEVENTSTSNVESTSNDETQTGDDETETSLPDSFWTYQQDPASSMLYNSITTRDLISWSFQIARGMDYLASRKVLHGDLAARNILLAEDGVVKVADFGMSRNMYYEGNYQKKGQGLMPVKWMAIESLTDRTFSTQSDVWAFGILLWELFSLGKVPYPGMNADDQFIKQLQNGYRMDKPEYAPNGMGEIMRECWNANPKERPTFSQLEVKISDNLETAVSEFYLDLNFSYAAINEETKNASTNDALGLMKELDTKPIEPRSKSLFVKVDRKRDHSVRLSRKFSLNGLSKPSQERSSESAGTRLNQYV